VASSDEVRSMALSLAEQGQDTDAAVRELLAFCEDHRVPVVVARQSLSEGDRQDASADRAIELLDAVLERGSWA
jgi:hypothetical protein